MDAQAAPCGRHDVGGRGGPLWPPYPPLYPPEFDETGRAWGCYNYFEDDFWESWGLNADKGVFSSNKIGGGAFCTAVLAGYVLTALYSQSYGIVTVDGSYVRERGSSLD